MLRCRSCGRVFSPAELKDSLDGLEELLGSARCDRV